MKILAFGDSITSGFFDSQGGWVSRLKVDIGARSLKDMDDHEVFNLGISGDRTAGLLKRIEAECSARHLHENDYRILIAIGINDAIASAPEGIPEVSDDDFYARYEQIVDIAQRFGNVTLLSLVAVDEKLVWPMPWDQVRGYQNERIALFNSYIRDIAKLKSVPLVDITEPFLENPGQFLQDGVHPNDAGHQLIYEKVTQSLGV